MSGAALCLDLSRLVSRVGRGPWTGVDRVEAAYLERLLGEGRPVFGLVRGRLGYALLDRAGMAALWAGLPGRADLRPVARCVRPGLARMLRRRLPAGCVYLNVGHSNLTERVFGAWAGVAGARIAVLVHDLIPLSHPETQRAGMPALFEARMRRVAGAADLVLCNSAATEAEVRRVFAGWGRCPETVAAPLGVRLAEPEPVARPAGRYCVVLGTVEPRKGHAVLLDVWERIGPDVATLIVAGRRGWANAAVFERLDRGVPGVVERAGMRDGQVRHLLEGAAALLFPSRAEGYGLPAVEAAALGCPVLCSDIAVFREVLGEYPVYLPPGDSYAWEKAIRAAVSADGHRPTPRPAPSWEAHFNRVLTLT